MALIITMPNSFKVINIDFIKQENIVKESISARELNSKERPYILCKPTLVTGFYWLMVQDENKSKCPEYVVITGADPMAEMRVRYEFSVASNKFIFYVVGKRECFTEDNEEYIEYFVDREWDILYPVDSGRAFKLPSRYITKADLHDYGYAW